MLYKKFKQVLKYLQMHAIDLLMTGTHIIEIIIATFLGIVVFFWSVRLLGQITMAANMPATTESFHELLEFCFSLIIIVEFVRMLIKHSMMSVVEVLVFAIARGLIVDHENAVNMLISIACIAILMFVRRFALDDQIETNLKKSGNEVKVVTAGDKNDA
ncbi:MAG: hypothetical protein J6P61_04450 [Erysipelotrichaceae bacterium]|nr:hypothetical protein [Erysipelotrichaceae bacterium]